MKRLVNQTLPSNTFTTFPLSTMRDHAIQVRKLALSQLSGYPAGSHVVGVIQRRIDTSSIKSLLTSLLHIRNLSRLASDIIATAPAARVDKQQFVRSELLAYVEMQAKVYGAGDLTPEDQDLIAYMIASTESPDNSWMLDFDMSDKNKMLEFHKLYDTLTYRPGAVSIRESEGATPYTIDDITENSNLVSVIYDPEKDTVIHISETRKYKERVSEAMAIRSAAGNRSELEARLNQLHANASSTLGYSQMRVLDHVFNLLTSTEVWDQWITPRTKSDMSSNEERGRGLKNFAAYLHSLLMYPHFFAIEAFLETYNMIETTLVKFVPLPPHEVARYDAHVRKFDVLNAKGDVSDIFSYLKGSRAAGHDSKISVFPVEYVSLFGFEDALNAALIAASKLTLPTDITELKRLANAEFNTLTLSHPVSKFDVIHEINDLIIVKGIVSNHLKDACNAISSGVPKFLSADTLHALSSMSLSVNYSMGVHIDISPDPTMASPDEFVDGSLKCHVAFPSYNYTAVNQGQKDMLYTVNSAANFSNALMARERVVKIPAFAHKLRVITGHQDWSCLLPATLHYNAEYYTTDMLKASPVMLERLLETLTGMNFNLIKRTIGNPYSRELFATYLSSFALMYITSEESSNSTEANVATGQLVHGYGKPYGATYESLEAKQGKMNPDMLVKLTDRVTIRILKKIPLPTDALQPQAQFMINFPHFCYVSNSKTLDVTKWVIAPGLMNFALAPMNLKAELSPVVLDKRFAYLNDALFIQTDPMWRPTVAEDSIASIKSTTRTWNRDMFYEELEYRVLSSYGNSPDIATAIKPEGEETVINTLIKEMTASSKEVLDKAPSTHPENAKSQIIQPGDLPSNKELPSDNSDNGPVDFSKGPGSKKGNKKE